MDSEGPHQLAHFPYLFTESMDSLECINGLQHFWWAYTDQQDDVDLHFACDGIFFALQGSNTAYIF